MEEVIKLSKKDLTVIEGTVEKFLAELELEATFSLNQNEDVVEVAMETQDSGIIIGYHGEMLESLQLVLSLVVAKKLGHFVRISIEVDGYKKNRIEYLHNLALQVKERALAEHKEQALMSLKSWERRAVHLFLQNDEEVTSESSGEGRDRVLLIRPK